jgi:hypothetical protein
MDQIEQLYDLCNELSKLFNVRLTNISILRMKKKLVEVEGKELDAKDAYELEAEGTIRESKAEVEELAVSVQSIVLEWDGSRLAVEQRKKKLEADKLSAKQAKIKKWRDELFRSAIKIQAAWRGLMVRVRLEVLTLHRACVYVQCRTRGFLCRSDLRRREVNRIANVIQNLGRGFIARKRAAKRAGRVYPPPDLVEAFVKASGGVGGEDEDVDANGNHKHTPAAEYVADMFDAELDRPALANKTAQPKGQWAMLRYSGQRKALEEAKKSCLNDRKNGSLIGKLAMLALEHGLADSNFTTTEKRLAFVKVAAGLFERAEENKHDEHGLYYRKRGDAMFKAFTMHGVRLEHEYLYRAVDAYEKALK